LSRTIGLDNKHLIFTLYNFCQKKGCHSIFIAEENKKEAKYLDFNFYLPVNWDVEPSNKKKMSFVGDISIKNALHFRQANDEDSFYPSLEKAREYAEKNNIALEDRFHLCIQQFLRRIYF
jgi:hypothetical protein